MRLEESLNDRDARIGSQRDQLDHLMPAEYETLREIAQRQLATRGGVGTLSPTGLVHEAYLRLADGSRAVWGDRGHFIALVAVAMRCILIDRARARNAQRRQGRRIQVTLDDQFIDVENQSDALLQLNDAIDWLANVEPRLARVVDCRFFGGFSEEETAEALGVTKRTVQREWAKARMLLRRALSE